MHCFIREPLEATPEAGTDQEKEAKKEEVKGSPEEKGSQDGTLRLLRQTDSKERGSLRSLWALCLNEDNGSLLEKASKAAEEASRYAKTAAEFAHQAAEAAEAARKDQESLKRSDKCQEVYSTLFMLI